MRPERIEVLIVGGGQAGLAMSEHLSNHGVQHLILERRRVAERWRSERWDSLRANGPAWHDRFPSLEFANVAADAFASKHEVADYFQAYADMINAPIRCGVEVMSVRRNHGRPGFSVITSDGELEAEYVVVATGPFQQPAIPPLVPADAPVTQIHSSAYHHPQQLDDGAVLVVGAGSSGAQIAEELLRAGKQVYLSVGPHDRPPRSYRGRDFVWWLGVLGKWDLSAREPGVEHVTIAVSGAYGGRTMDFRRLAEDGMTLLGLTTSYESGVMRFAANLQTNLDRGDANYHLMLDEADAYIERNGLDLPVEDSARTIRPSPACVTAPVRELDLSGASVNTIIWATGFSSDYQWLQVDALDESGQPQHQRGISTEPGVYFLGLPFLSHRGSSFIWGVWHDAKFLADHISTQGRYVSYRSSDELDSRD